MERISVVIVSGGSGKRLGSKIPKGLIKISTREMFLYSLMTFQTLSDLVGKIILVTPRSHTRDFSRAIEKSSLSKPYKIVKGGARRQDSVHAGLCVIPDSDDIVLIHDAARPFVTPVDIVKLVDLVKQYGAATTAVRVRDTIRRGELTCGTVLLKRTITRENLWALGTPQGFKLKDIRNAHDKARARNIEASDDTALLPHGRLISVLEVDYLNFKVTFPEDLEHAKFLIEPWQKRFQDGGYRIPGGFF